jgi:hypothetical protein
MLLIDNKLYFKYKDDFYMTQRQDFIKYFEQYFDYIN